MTTRPASRPGGSEHLNLLQSFASAHGAKPTTPLLSSSKVITGQKQTNSTQQSMIQAFSKLGMEDGTGSNGNTEERYSVYDDDESWPRKLNTEERQMAGELFDAVEVGALERTEEILKEVPPLANVIRLSQNSDFPLYLAAGMGDIRMVQLLVAHDCSVHARTVHGHTALHAAALFGHPNIVQYLLGCGLEVNAVNSEGFPLIEEVLEDIEYDLDESEQMNISDPSKLECTAMILLENGAHIADPEIYADKFCDEYKDVADPRLQKLLLKQLDRFMEEEEARATFDDDNDDDDVLMDKTKLDLNFKQDEDGGIIDSLSDGGGKYGDSGDDDDNERQEGGQKMTIKTPESKKGPSPRRGKSTRLRRRKYSKSSSNDTMDDVKNSTIQAPTPPNKMGRKGGRPTPKSGGRPAPPPRKGKASNVQTPTPVKSYTSKINDDSNNNSSTKKQQRSNKKKSNNNGNDSDSSLEISWSEQLKQDEERAKRKAEGKNANVKLPQI